ncbi:MAG TPA: ligase-associated DNA damage response exonuclease [Kiritimatiellia bacterium]|nr:ligase-associated DNA damage response exonuclease [Kiritimatiellia bacterium]HMO99180.1 ligase-associated DNA damage response exonuclease [Kiritimatiellia bacterium]HMP95767.1 ligase-associated DNA damage response exonuclease [Kiritimatiellia bacterium]
MQPNDVIQPTAQGLFCPRGNFYIDPWRPVERALVTHAHADHARWGCDAYMVASEGLGVFRARLGSEARIETLSYGETRTINDVNVSFHPAGHILGSAQIRLEVDGEVWVVTGDYKTGLDPTCAPYEPVRCTVMITESTFGLPVYRWPDPAVVFEAVNAWWRENAAAGLTSVVFGYALGKAQRLLAGLDATIGPVYTHGAVEAMCEVYRAAGVSLPVTRRVERDIRLNGSEGALVVAPPSADDSPWMRRFQPYATAFASGWMLVRGARRRRAVDRGFVLSDHVDWPSLLAAVEASGAERVGVTHGNAAVVARFLNERGRTAWAIPSRYTGENDDDSSASAEETGGAS